MLDPIDLARRLTSLRVQDFYNLLLKKGWTLGSAQALRVLQGAIRYYHEDEVRILEGFWRQACGGLVVSLVPHFNRALFESLRRVTASTPFVTILTDIADYPPHFWIERQEQFFICGSDRAAQQARDMGSSEQFIYQTSGMILHPRFYQPILANRHTERQRLGLTPHLPTGLVLFGGQGSEKMLEIAKELDKSGLDLQLIFLCGRNEKLAEQLRHRRGRLRTFVGGFTTEVPYYMYLADFFIGKPGPGSVSEALVMKLPVIVERNARTLPQERYNTDWIVERQVGMVVRGPREISRALAEFLQPENFARYRSNAAALNNCAVFEIPAILHEIVERAAGVQ